MKKIFNRALLFVAAITCVGFMVSCDDDDLPAMDGLFRPVISDGDNIQYCQHAMAKIFEQSGRGQMALNWTISPALVDFSPAMLNYYYGKATNNDCFVCGPSGLGYAMPFNGLGGGSGTYYTSSGPTITPYIQLTQRYIEKDEFFAILGI